MFNIKNWFRRKYPSKEWLAEAKYEAKNTPDILELETRPMQLLFLPCELMSHHLQGALTAQGGVRLYDAQSVDGYTLYRDRRTNRATLLKEGDVAVKGELWGVLSSFISSLDKYKEHGVECLRKRTKVVVYDGANNHRFLTLPAWVYEGIPKYWEPQLDNGYNFPKVKKYTTENPFLPLAFFYYHPNECIQK